MNDLRAPWQVPPVSTRVLTDRLALRPPRTTDVPELRRVLRANSEHLRPWSAAPSPGEDPCSLTSVSRAVLRHRREWKRGQAFVLLVTTRENDDRIIGRIALGGVLLGAFRNAYLGYWIDAEHQGRAGRRRKPADFLPDNLQRILVQDFAVLRSSTVGDCVNHAIFHPRSSPRRSGCEPS